MDEPNRWGTSRCVGLLAAVALHLAVLAVLLSASRPGALSSATDESVQLVFLPPMNFPKVRSQSARPRRSSGEKAAPTAPPLFANVPSSASSPGPASSSDGGGSGIDWAAEARRALQAYEIRKFQPPTSSAISHKSWEEGSGPAPNQAGHWFRAANGDWMVWVNASCYKLASSGPKSYAVLPQTVCPANLRPQP